MDNQSSGSFVIVYNTTSIDNNMTPLRTPTTQMMTHSFG